MSFLMKMFLIPFDIFIILSNILKSTGFKLLFKQRQGGPCQLSPYVLVHRTCKQRMGHSQIAALAKSFYM